MDGDSATGAKGSELWLYEAMQKYESVASMHALADIQRPLSILSKQGQARDTTIINLDSQVKKCVTSLKSVKEDVIS